MKMIKVLLVLTSSLILSCGNSQDQADSALKRMKVENYFTQPVQIELAKAVENGNVGAIDAAVARGADVNKIGKEQMTPLAWAICKQNKRGFQRLLEKGADPNFKADELGPRKAEVSVMELVSIAGDPDYLRVALQYGGNPNAIISNVSGQTVLNSAIENRRHENIKILVGAGSNINHQDKGGFTPIMMASNITQYDIVFNLMQMGADLSIRHHVIAPDGTWRKNAGKTLAEQIQQMGDRSIRVLGKEKEQRQWYNKVVTELKRRELM